MNTSLRILQQLRRAVVGTALLAAAWVALAGWVPPAEAPMDCDPENDPYCHEMPYDPCDASPCDSQSQICCVI